MAYALVIILEFGQWVNLHTLRRLLGIAFVDCDWSLLGRREFMIITSLPLSFLQCRWIPEAPGHCEISVRQKWSVSFSTETQEVQVYLIDSFCRY